MGDKMQKNGIILGSGITGLSAGLDTKCTIYEASNIAGGICASYYMDLNGRISYYRQTEDSYRFEIGGGHWIFGADKEILNFITSLVKVNRYKRNSAVYLPDLDLYIPYPLQDHLIYLPEEIREKILKEILDSENGDKDVNTLSDWLEINFGKTLCELFFFPFHKLYTADLYTQITPQDKFKTPINKKLILKGIKEKSPNVGYNASFVYPQKGLDMLIRKMAERCKINFNKKVVKIVPKRKEIYFEDGETVKYDMIISTLPLNKMLQLTEIKIEESIIPCYTSVLVVNIGAKKGKKLPAYHWIYFPKSKSGFHRVGFYSNVDKSFSPISFRENNDRVVIYVEKAFLGGNKPSSEEIKSISKKIVAELMEAEYISEAEVVNTTWIDVAYTWQTTNANWQDETINILRENNIYQIGRYGKWKFQGIVDSIKDGFKIKKILGY